MVLLQANRRLVTISTGSLALGPELPPVNSAPVGVVFGKLSFSVSKSRWLCFHTDLVAPCEQVQMALGGYSISRERKALPLRKVNAQMIFPTVSLVDSMILVAQVCN